MSRKRLIPVMALGLLGAFAAVPAAQAHPDDAMGAAACVLAPGSVAGTTTVGGEDGVNNIVFDDLGIGGGWDPVTNLLDTDPGRFTFSGSAVCAGLDAASEDGTGPEVVGPTVAPGPPPTATATIKAAGDFDNLICGTGTANGDAIIEAPVPADPGTANPGTLLFTEFGIKFVAGVGQLSFVVDADETAPAGGTVATGQRPTEPDRKEANMPMGGYPASPAHSHVGDNQIDGGEGQGVITITPNELKPPPGSAGNCLTTNVTEFIVNGAFYAFLSGEGATESGAGGAGADDSDN